MEALSPLWNRICMLVVGWLSSTSIFPASLSTAPPTAEA